VSTSSKESLGLTPSQTVGPYLSIGLTWPDGVFAADPGSQGAFWLRGRLFDGAGAPIPDGLVESWQADPDGGFDSPEDPRGGNSYPGFRGYARSATAADGSFEIFTRKPGRVPDGAGGWQAPHVDLSVFARGMLDRVVTRVYFADTGDALLASLTVERRRTLIAVADGATWRWDIRLQGDGQTVFFTTPAFGL